MKHEFATPPRSAVALDPHPLCHTALSTLLARLNIDLVGAATSTGSTLRLLREHQPDLLVLEVDVPEGLDAALRLISIGSRETPDLTVIVLSGTDDRAVIDAAFDRGAASYVLKTSDPNAIATAIRQAFEPSLYLSRPSHAVQMRAENERSEVLHTLTRRELEILQLVSGGRSNREVAQILWVADQTVKFHLANVYRKLGVSNRFEAARWAQDNGMLDVVVESGEAISPAERNGNGVRNPAGALVPLRRPNPQSSSPTVRLEGTSR